MNFCFIVLSLLRGVYVEPFIQGWQKCTRIFFSLFLLVPCDFTFGGKLFISELLNFINLINFVA